MGICLGFLEVYGSGCGVRGCLDSAWMCMKVQRIFGMIDVVREYPELDEKGQEVLDCL